MVACCGGVFFIRPYSWSILMEMEFGEELSDSFSSSRTDESLASWILVGLLNLVGLLSYSSLPESSSCSWIKLI